MRTNYINIKAVFWDHTELCDEQGVQKIIAEAGAGDERETIEWIMSGFLERERYE